MFYRRYLAFRITKNVKYNVNRLMYALPWSLTNRYLVLNNLWNYSTIYYFHAVLSIVLLVLEIASRLQWKHNQIYSTLFVLNYWITYNATKKLITKLLRLLLIFTLIVAVHYSVAMIIIIELAFYPSALC